MNRIITLSLAFVLCGCGETTVTTPGVLVIDPAEATVILPANQDASPQEVAFKLQNGGGQPLTITRIELPCCNSGVSLAQPVKERTLQPNDSTELILKATPPRIGHFDRFVRVHTNISSSNPATIAIHFAGEELRPPYFIIEPPRNVQLSGSNRGSRAYLEFKVTAAERAGTKPWINSMTTNSARISITQSNQPEDQEFHEGVVIRTYTFQVVATTPESEDMPEAAAVEINMSSQPQKPLDGILITARLVPPVRAVPSQLVIGRERFESFPIERKILLVSSNQGDSFTVASDLPEWLEVNEDGGSVPNRTKRYLLSIKSPATKSAVLETTLEFRGDDKGSTIVRVPIRVSLEG